MNTVIFTGNPPAPTETFIRAHIDQIPGNVRTIYDHGIVRYGNGAPILSQRFLPRAFRKAKRHLGNHGWEFEIQLALKTGLLKYKPDVVLAEYGPAGVTIYNQCREQKIPLVVHFHGFDASKTEVLNQHRGSYKKMFEYASAIIAVSHAMENKLVDAGCPTEKLVYSPYGVPEHFQANLERKRHPQTLLSVGRFVEKKAPQLTITAFKRVVDSYPKARLRMVGDGPLLSPCKDLAKALKLQDNIDFLGSCTHEQVSLEMATALCFVQHSIAASDGDMEGTPVAILEAGFAGLPVIATRHAGIPDVVLEGETGLLCDEHNIDTMAQNMLAFLNAPTAASKMGYAAAAHISENFPMHRSIERLTAILNQAASHKEMTKLPEFEISS